MESATSTLETLSKDIGAFIAEHQAVQADAEAAAVEAKQPFEKAALPTLHRFVEGVQGPHKAVDAAAQGAGLSVTVEAVTEQGTQYAFAVAGATNSAAPLGVSAARAGRR